MSKVVLDASAILALLNDETGAAQVQAALPGSIISSVNYSEVVARLSILGMPDVEIHGALDILGLEIIPFDEEQAFQAGALAQATRPHGLSLGDRACLALAQRTDYSALTADKIWQNLNLGVEIQVIR